MMNFLEIALYILIFILCLSTLIVVHELGHLTAAKIFKVYCLEFSIGFGPAFIKKKRKKGETYFSLRVIPFGGYVSMYTEGVELPDGVEIPRERSLEGLKKWKKAIIMVAGVFMNSVLALTLFFVNNIAFQDKYIYPHISSVAEGSIAETAGVPNNSYIRLYGMTGNEGLEDDKTVYNTEFYTQGYMYLGEKDLDFATIYYTNGQTLKAGQFVNKNLVTGFTNTNLADLITFYAIKDNAITKDLIEINGDVEKVGIVIRSIPIKEETDDKGNTKRVLDYENSVAHSLSVKVIQEGERDKATYKLEDFGYSLAVIANKQLTFGEAVKQTFVDFGEGAISIVKGLVSIFTTKEGINNVSGLVGLGAISSNVLKNFGLGKFIYIWGLISVNLAVINLLPFPGLDGWHILVLIIEGITKKKIPEKVKTIVSYIGIGILFILMGAIIIKDIIGLATGTLLTVVLWRIKWWDS